MKVDIDQLTEPDLIDLNHRIVARLRFFEQMRAHSQMLDYRVGDRVTFQPLGQGPVEGVLTRYNRKMVTMVADDGRHWMCRRTSAQTQIADGLRRAWIRPGRCRESIGR